jgi:hypothetical protein
MKAVKILTLFLFLALPAMAENGAKAAPPVIDFNKERRAAQEQKIETKLGTVYIGMTESALYKIYQEQDRLLIPQSILNKEWLVFRDWTSSNPNDVITFYIENATVVGWERHYNPSPANTGSIYEYKANEIIKRWFFPPGKPRWDGSKLNLLDWNKLTRIQKVMFLKEYMDFINKKFNTKISIDIDKYILGMNFYSDNCSEGCLGVFAGDAVNNLLISDQKAAAEQTVAQKPAVEQPVAP